MTATLVNPSPVPLDARRKFAELNDLVRSFGSVLVAYSGGVDSTLLLRVCHDALGSDAVAASGLSQTYADEEMAEAKAIADEMGVQHLVVATMELTDPRYADNTHQRCFFCKTELYGRLGEVARERGLSVLVDGTNADDLGDFGRVSEPDVISASGAHWRKLVSARTRSAPSPPSLVFAHGTSLPSPASRRASRMAIPSRSRSCERSQRPNRPSAAWVCGGSASGTTTTWPGSSSTGGPCLGRRPCGRNRRGGQVRGLPLRRPRS
jgi:hypothetical protein